jgi:low temperature requirement protein LtrA
MTDRPAPIAWRLSMRGRDPNEAHRGSTPLELLFDLCFVVAVSAASASHLAFQQQPTTAVAGAA